MNSIYGSLRCCGKKRESLKKYFVIKGKSNNRAKGAHIQNLHSRVGKRWSCCKTKRLFDTRFYYPGEVCRNKSGREEAELELKTAELMAFLVPTRKRKKKRQDGILVGHCPKRSCYYYRT